MRDVGLAPWRRDLLSKLKREECTKWVWHLRGEDDPVRFSEESSSTRLGERLCAEQALAEPLMEEIALAADMACDHHHTNCS